VEDLFKEQIAQARRMHGSRSMSACNPEVGKNIMNTLTRQVEN
jgi:hypothetical protein